jgi:DNA-binding CsgD family transcriptional regulator
MGGIVARPAIPAAPPGSSGLYPDAVTEVAAEGQGDWLPRLEEWCRAPVPAKQLREGILTRLRTQLPWDGHVFCLCDPQTRVLTSPLADVPGLPWERLPELARWRYLTTLNRIDMLVGAGPRSLRGAGTAPEESLVWRHVQRDLGVVDTASMAFADRYGAWGFLELWRLTDPFTDAELERLSRVQPAVTDGLRSAVARTFAAGGRQGGAASGPAVVVLDPGLQVRAQPDAAAEALLRLNPPDEPMEPIPASAYNVGAALVAQEFGVPLGEPSARVHLGSGHWVTVRASRLGGDVAVSIEPSTASERADLVARSAGLSGREVEVLREVAAGRTSSEIAERLYLSEHTVDDHVQAVLERTGARTRQHLLARILGTSDSDGMAP